MKNCCNKLKKVLLLTPGPIFGFEDENNVSLHSYIFTTKTKYDPRNARKIPILNQII